MPKKSKVAQPVDTNGNVILTTDSTGGLGKHKKKSKKAEPQTAVQRHASGSSSSSGVFTNGNGALHNGNNGHGDSTSVSAAPTPKPEGSSAIESPLIDVNAQASLDTSISTVNVEPKVRLPSLVAPAFQRDVSASEPNLADHSAVSSPVGHHQNNSIGPSTIENQASFLETNPYAVEDETLPQSTRSPHPSASVSVLFGDETDGESMRPRDEVLDFDAESAFEVPAVERPPSMVYTLQSEVDVLVPVASSAGVTRETSLSRNSSKKDKTSLKSKSKSKKGFYSEPAPPSFEEEMERNRSQPRSNNRRTKFVKPPQAEVGLEFTPESVVDESVRAYKHRPQPVVLPAKPPEASNSGKRRRDSLEASLVPANGKKKYKTSEFVFPGAHNPNAALQLSVSKPNCGDEPSPLILPDPSAHLTSGILIRDLRHLLENEAVNSELATEIVQEFVRTEQPLPYLHAQAFLPSPEDGHCFLFQVCPPHLAPLVEEEHLPRVYRSNEELLDNQFMHKVGPQTDEEGHSHDFLHAIMPFNMYLNWLSDHPEFDPSKSAVVVSDDLARLYCPPVADEHYAETVYFPDAEQLGNIAAIEAVTAHVAEHQKIGHNIAKVGDQVITKEYMLRNETVRVAMPTRRLGSTPHRPILARIASGDEAPPAKKPLPQYIVRSLDQSYWNPYYKQSHGLVKDCGVSTIDDDDDDLEFEIDPNVVDALLDDSDSDSDGDGRFGFGVGATTGTGTATGTGTDTADLDDDLPPQTSNAAKPKSSRQVRLDSTDTMSRTPSQTSIDSRFALRARLKM